MLHNVLNFTNIVIVMQCTCKWLSPPVPTLAVPTCSVFESMVIPYPKRKFLTEDDNTKDEKADAKVQCLE